nr:hypothetical protein [Tanacetum cinerariifolium]
MLETNVESRVRGYKAAHTKRMEWFENAIFKQREEINDKRSEMLGLLKELTANRTPKKVLIREKARHPITKHVNSISLIRVKEEKNFEGNEVVNENVMEPDRSDAVVPPKEIDKMNGAENRIERVDGEFNFLPEGCLDENQSSTKSVNNEASMINAEPISIVHPSDIAENIVDSRNTSSEEGGLSSIGPDAPSYLEVGKRSKVAGKRKVVVGSHGKDPHRKTQKVPAQASKVARDASTPFDVDSDPDIHEFPSAKELKDMTDCHWVIAHDSRTKFCIARESCDTIQEREMKKDKAYAELEKKCNEALQDLGKNPLVFYMRTEIETLQSQVNGLHSKYSRLILEEKKLINYEKTLSILHAKDRAVVVARVISDAAMKLICSDEMGVFIARLGKASIIHDRCAVFEEVAELKKPFILEEMSGYHPSSKEEYDRAGNDLANASYLSWLS